MGILFNFEQNRVFQINEFTKYILNKLIIKDEKKRDNNQIIQMFISFLYI